MGHFSRDIGAEFEDAVATRLTVLKQQRIVARYQHNGPTWRKRGAYYRPTVPSGADFAGMLYGGLAFACEAKTTGFDKRTGKGGEFIREERIPQTQLDDLEITAQCGGLAVLALQFRPGPLAPWSIFVVPWQKVPWRKRKILHSVSADALEPWRLHADQILFERFLIRSEKGMQIMGEK